MNSSESLSFHDSARLLLSSAMETCDLEFWRLLAAARNPERTYTVQSNKHCAYYSGSLQDGLQALVGRIRSEKILVLFFSNLGSLYDIQRRTLPTFVQPPEEPQLEVNDLEFCEYFQSEFGFMTASIQVKQFTVSDDESGFWVGPLP